MVCADSRVRLLLALSLFMSLTQVVRAEDPGAEVEKLARSFGQAWAVNDIATLEPMLAPAYLHTDIKGNALPRAAWLDYMREQKKKDLVFTIEFADVKTTVYGDIVLITGENLISVIGQPGPKLQRLRFTQVWAKQDGKWLRVAFQATSEADR